MKALLMLIAISTAPALLFAQQINREFGAVSLEELNMESYEKDPAAEAVVLYDIGKSHFQHTDQGFEVVFERRTRIKILNKAGYRWSEISIPYYREGSIFEKITDLKGITYTMEQGGMTKTPLDLSATFDEKVNEMWNVKKFTMPNIKEGSVIEFTYKLISPYKFNLQDWTFQRQIPTVYSEYTVKMIPFYEYTYLFQGASGFDRQESHVEKGMARRFGGIEFQDMVYIFGMEDVPAFRDQEFITSINDYIIKIDFQLSQVHQLNGATNEIITTWPKLCNDLLKHPDFGKFANSCEKKSAKLNDLPDLANTSKIEKTKALVDYVKSNFTWNGINSKYAYKKVNDFLKEKNGTSADINLFLTGLLNAHDIEAHPVLISTREHGKIKTDYPFNHFFNYTIVLAKTDEGMLLLDGSNKLCPYNLLPVKCRNEQGLIIEKNGDKWVDLTDPSPSVIQEDIRLTLDGDNKWQVKLNMRMTGYDALTMRSSAEGKQENIEEIFLKNGFADIQQVHIENHELTARPYIVRLDASAAVEQIGDHIYVSPFLGRALTENPFKLESRSYPIDMVYAKKRKYNSEVRIPEGYVVDHLPESYTIDNDLVEVAFSVSQTDDEAIRLTGEYYFKKPVYSPADYGKLKYYYNQIIKHFNDKIGLKKEI